ncbi:DNA transposase THAP9 isoform B [Alligator mississippiensis]|uniref:DNA transposase THAP9 isoform B n=1 Tax=Alligator mississippiensis TaxID=8496 RepID=A0A151P0S4_ALLMI|nr:DNA transposase THAP9 isoform B [Alligator mississippiensis]
MTRSCSALGCSARDNGRSRERGISFHQFPIDATQRNKWILAVNRADPKSKKKITERSCAFSFSIQDLPWGLPGWRQMAEYSAAMRQFACTLHIYSSKAYDYLRKIFPLPHPSSLTIWLSSDDANPGFSNSIFSHLQQKVEKGDQAYQYCSLLVDGLALRKQLDWDPRIQHLTGFMDLGAAYRQLLTRDSLMPGSQENNLGRPTCGMHTTSGTGVTQITVSIPKTASSGITSFTASEVVSYASSSPAKPDESWIG